MSRTSHLSKCASQWHILSVGRAISRFLDFLVILFHSDLLATLSGIHVALVVCLEHVSACILGTQRFLDLLQRHVALGSRALAVLVMVNGVNSIPGVYDGAM